MSMYKLCSAAARQLTADPSLADTSAYDGLKNVFTELDVLLLAKASVPGEWNDDEWREAMIQASNVMGTRFRAEQVVRYGPVRLPGVDEQDYLRAQSKIIYAAPDGPAKIKTPNGTFPRMFTSNDPVQRAGRRVQADRNDLVRWDQQGITDPSRRPQTAEQREILRLKSENQALVQRLAEAEQEIDRLRTHNVQVVSVDELERLLESRRSAA